MSEYRFRQGHHEDRNLWQHHIDEPPESKSGECVGQVFDSALAAEICAAVNERRAAVTARDAGRASRTEQVEHGIRHWFAQTYGDETPAPRLLVEGIRGHLGNLVGDELLRLDTQIAGLQAELERLRAQDDPGEVEQLAIELAEERTQHQAARALIRDLADDEPCSHLDHHGYCQTHGWFETNPPCPHGRARQLAEEGQ